jgi:hypothetical protein
MSNKIILFSVISLLLFSLATVHAEVAVSTPSGTTATTSADTKESNDVKNIKEKLASITRKKDQRAVAGYCKIIDNKISLIDSGGLEYAVLFDESLTKVYHIAGSSKKEIKSKDLKQDMYIVVTGPTVDKSVSANEVLVDDVYIVQSGKIIEINKSDYFIKITAQDKEEYTLDIEAGTKQNMVNPKTLEIEKTGFSKIKEGDIVHFAAKKDRSDKNSKNRFAAQKILVIPQEYFIK